MVVKVVNLRRYRPGHRGKRLKEVYIGRGSIFGNKFMIPRDGDRSEVINKYWEDLDNQTNSFWQNLYALQELMDVGYEIRLMCYCSPLPCHGDILKELIEEYI